MAGMSCQFEWDPGCSCCLLNSTTWEKLAKADPSLQLEPAPQVITANGQPMNVMGKLSHSITLPNNVSYHWQFIVVNDIAADGFIGSDLMQAAFAITDHAHNVVYFNHSKKSPPTLSDCACITLASAPRTQNLTTPLELPTSAKVYLTSSVYIRPQCKRVAVISTQSVHPSFSGIVEPNSVFEDKGLLALPSLFSPTQQSQMLLAVVNMSDHPVKLSSGLEVGIIQSTDSVTKIPPLKLEQICHAVQPIEQVDMLPSHSVHLPFYLNLNDTDLNPAQVLMVKCLLDEFKDIFSLGPFDIGCTPLLQHTIDTTQDKPILVRPRRLPIHVQAEVQVIIDDMLKFGIIQPSQSPWCAPVVVVAKKDGSKRLCVDFRKLNSITIRDSYPLPRIEDVLNVLAGCRYFSALDMKAGYHQVEVAPADRAKTAFSIGTGLYEWLRLPFGLVNAPASFSRLMCILLAGLSFEEVVSYLDDILIYSRTFEEHLQALRRVFERFRAANLKLSPEKCTWFQKQTAFLGFLVSKEGVATHPEKIEKVKAFPTPTNTKTVRTFLGLASYYRKYVHQFAKIAHPLTQLLRKENLAKKQFSWTGECETAFQTLKSKLISAPILALPRFGEPFQLSTDASNFAVGCVLEQVQDGELRVIAYASQVLPPNKRKWSAFQREAYALLWASRKFRPYILGGKVSFITDHAPLTHLRNKESIPEKVQTYFLELEQYDYTLTHRPGKRHGNADALSRLSLDEANDNLPLESCQRLRLTSDCNIDWNTVQNEDGNLRTVKQWMLEGKPKREAAGESEELNLLWNVFAKLHIDKDSGTLYKLNRTGKHQFVVPHNKREEALKTFHDLPTSGHRGITQTYEKICDQLWWPKLKEDVHYWCNSCTSCARFKTHHLPKAPIQSLVAGHPNEVVAIDFVGPMPGPTKLNNVYLLVMVDHFTRYAEAVALPDRQASSVAKALMREWITRHGLMEVLHSDQAQEFESDLLAELCTLLHIKKSRSSPFHPEGNSVCERLNGTLLSILKPCMSAHPDDWDTLVPHILMAYRSTRHSSTGFTPNYLMTGREMRLPAHVIFPSPEIEPQLVTEYARQLRHNLQTAFRDTSLHLSRSHEHTKDRSQHYARYRPYEIGDLVYVLTPKGSRGKLGEVWCGPWKVVCRTGVIYTLEWVQPGKKKRNRRYHFNLLKLCLPRSENRWDLPNCEGSEKTNSDDMLFTRRMCKPPDRFGDWEFS